MINSGNQEIHDHLYWEFHAQGGKQAVRKGNWKAVRLNYYDKKKTKVELYDLEEDPTETNDVATEFPEIVQEMINIMDEEHTDNDVFPFTGVK